MIEMNDELCVHVGQSFWRSKFRGEGHCIVTLGRE